MGNQAPVEDLRAQYDLIAPLADRLRNELCSQIQRIVIQGDITLAVPIESRVKSWTSISEKLMRKRLQIEQIAALDDLVGIRIISLFKRDAAHLTEQVSKTFDVLGSEDAGTRLGESQFGYQSFHQIVRIPESWLAVPTFKDLRDLRAEIQVRSLAQHLWAAASHKLQYKHEGSVPAPVRRSIHRVSALLETVDLELERTLDDRAAYSTRNQTPSINEPLNVDLLATILDQMLPAKNKDIEEDYAELLEELFRFGIKTSGALRTAIERHLPRAIEDDRKEVERIWSEEDFDGTRPDRLNAGVFYTHVGLVRTVLHLEFGEAYTRYWRERRANEVSTHL